jgi:hypothetical protein
MRIDVAIIMICGALGFFILMLTIYSTFEAALIVFCTSGIVGVMLGNSVKRKK